MMLNMLEWFFFLQACGYGLQSTANVIVASKAHGQFSCQTNSDNLVRTTTDSPRPESYATVVSSDYEHTEEKKS